MVNSATAADILAKLLTVDGAGSLLDADLLDGNHATAFADTVHTHVIVDVTDATANMQELVKETNLRGGFINDALESNALADMGYPYYSNKAGYYADAITDKTLSNVLIGGNSRTENGGVRIDTTQDPDTFEIYLRDQWNTIIYDFTTANNDLRHTPLSYQIYVWRGDSVQLDLGGRTMISEYEVDIGAYRAPRLLYGGTF